MIVVQFFVSELATAGTVFFDDGSAKKTGRLQKDWVSGLVTELEGLWSKAQEIINGIYQAIFGDDGNLFHDIWDIIEALTNIPATHIGGMAGLDNIVDVINETWNQLWGGFARTIGIDKSIADAANAASEVAGNADTAIQIGEWNNAVLGIRNNKSLMQGMDETSESNFLMTELFSNASAPPVEIAATSSNVPISFWRAEQDCWKGFVSWFGRGITGITGLYIDIYKLNYETEEMECIHSSTNQIGQFPDNSTYYLGQYFIPENLRPQVLPGQVWGIAWRVTGSGTHYIAGKSAGTWFPPDTSVTPQKPAATRNSGSTADVPFGSITYSNNIAWFGFGIVLGDVPPDYHAPRKVEFTTAGTGFIYNIPDWAPILDVSLCPGGGGGHGGNGGDSRAGDAGDAGIWMTERLVRGVDFPSNTTQLIIDVGAGGSKGNPGSNGGNGGNTVRRAIPGGKAALVAVGGLGGGGYNPIGDLNDYHGVGPGNTTNMGGDTFIGGLGGRGGKPGGNGAAPGGSGAGGDGGFFSVAWSGGAGARGSAHIVARQS